MQLYLGESKIIMIIVTPFRDCVLYWTSGNKHEQIFPVTHAGKVDDYTGLPTCTIMWVVLACVFFSI